MPPLHDIAHLGHVELRTPVLDESVGFFTRYLGLTEHGSAGDSVFLRAWDDYETITIKLTAHATSGVGRTNLRAAGPEALAADSALLERVDAFRRKAAQLMGLGDVSSSSVPKTVLLAAARDGGQVCTRSFIPVQPHTSIGVLGAVSVVTGMLLPGAVGHELTADWPRGSSQVDVEHPTGHLLVDVVVDGSVTPPRVIRSGVVRTARKLFDGTAYPRA